MSQGIEVGDLVQVIRPCPGCGNSKGLGAVYTVTSIGPCFWPSVCCGKYNSSLVAWGKPNNDSGYSVYEVKKIPPLTKQDIQEEELDLVTLS